MITILSKFTLTIVALTVTLGFVLIKSEVSFSVGVYHSQTQLEKQSISSIDITRPRKFPPREWRSTSEMNPLNFWSWMPDPTFGVAHFEPEKRMLTNKAGSYQVISINPSYEKLENRELVLVLLEEGTVHEIQLPTPENPNAIVEIGELYSTGEKSVFVVIYNFSDALLVELQRPIGTGRNVIVDRSDTQTWSETLESASLSIDGGTAIDRICKDKSIAPKLFIRNELGIKC